MAQRKKQQNQLIAYLALLVLIMTKVARVIVGNAVAVLMLLLARQNVPALGRTGLSKFPMVRVFVSTGMSITMSKIESKQKETVIMIVRKWSVIVAQQVQFVTAPPAPV